MSKSIAIVEDEETIRENYRDVFSRQGFRVSVHADRASALQAFKQHLPDLAVIDIGLGDDVDGGFNLCRELRALSPQIPIIFLTARDSELDIVSGLRLGADDYLTKDISVTQLVARVSALFRRVEALQEPEELGHTLSRGPLTLNLERMTAHWRGVLVDLTVTEFYLVQSLAKHPGHVKSRQQLMEAAKTVLDDNTITSHIKRLRKKFAALDSAFDAIQTAYGMGYRWQVNDNDASS
ncbi:MAG: proteobacterial dedicated sortase system response regulator [Pseudomonadales bacterium]|nr:proteobacterial dedicated sortase system response regulator [Pseudomonadales bacterium]